MNIKEKIEEIKVGNKEILKLIRSHYERNDNTFDQTVRDIVDIFRGTGKDELALYALAQLGETGAFTIEIAPLSPTTIPKQEFIEVLDDAFEDKSYLADNPQMIEEDALFEQVLNRVWEWIEEKLEQAQRDAVEDWMDYLFKEHGEWVELDEARYKNALKEYLNQTKEDMKGKQ